LGIIVKQTIKGTIYSYLGVGLGFITTAILLPHLLKPEEIGLLNLLVAFSAIFAQFASLGMNSVTTRLFSYFRSIENNHHGFLFILISVSLIGFILSTVGYFILKPSIIENNIEKSYLFVEYIYYLVPLVFFTLFFIVLDNYNKVLFNASYGIFLKEFYQRILILISIILFALKLISFRYFVLTYVISLSLPTINLIIHLIRKKEFSLKYSSLLLKQKMRKSMYSVAFFGILGGFSGATIGYVDKIMVNALLDIQSTGIYATAAFFGVIVIIPSRSLLKIASAVIADAWKAKNLFIIKDVYYKSCINQLIIALLIFIGIWANINNVFKIIPAEFIRGKYVIFFICLANLIDMGTGVNGIIIGTSKYYRWQTYFIIFLAVLTIISNYLLIPKWGITGAAIATALSGFIYNFSRYIFLLVIYKFQPFNYKYLIVLTIGVISYYGSTLLPELSNFILDIIFRSGIIIVIYLPMIYFFNISSDLNQKINEVFKR